MLAFITSSLLYSDVFSMSSWNMLTSIVEAVSPLISKPVVVVDEHVKSSNEDVVTSTVSVATQTGLVGGVVKALDTAELLD